LLEFFYDLRKEIAIRFNIGVFDQLSLAFLKDNGFELSQRWIDPPVLGQVKTGVCIITRAQK
jgi:hypothetical protein